MSTLVFVLCPGCWGVDTNLQRNASELDRTLSHGLWKRGRGHARDLPHLRRHARGALARMLNAISQSSAGLESVFLKY